MEELPVIGRLVETGSLSSEFVQAIDSCGLNLRSDPILELITGPETVALQNALTQMPHVIDDTLEFVDGLKTPNVSVNCTAIKLIKKSRFVCDLLLEHDPLLVSERAMLIGFIKKRIGNELLPTTLKPLEPKVRIASSKRISGSENGAKLVLAEFAPKHISLEPVHY